MISVQNRLPESGRENRVSIMPDSGLPLEGVLSYADNASQDGTFWNRKTAQLLQGDIRILTVRAGQNIKAMDVVAVEDGEAFKKVKSSSIPEISVESNNNYVSRVAKIGDYYVFAVSNNSNVGFSIYSYDKNGIQLSTQNMRDRGGYKAKLQIGYCGNKVVVYYYESYQDAWSGVLYEISDSGKLTPKDWNNFNYEIYGALPINNTQFIGFYANGELYAQIVDLSGTSPSYIKSTAIDKAGRNFANVISTTQISDENGKKRFCVCYIDTQDSNKAKAFILTLDSENNITTTSPITIENQCSDIKCVFLDGIVYINTGGGLYAFNEALTRLNRISIFSASSESSNGLIALKNYVLAFNGVEDTSHGTAIALKYENQAFTQSEKYRFNKEYDTRYFNGACISGNKAFVVYQSRASNISNDKATIEFFEVSNYQIANEFLVVSKDAIALANGTGGQKIPVGFGGYCECPDVTAGQRIDSAGVSAVSPQDGWLDILPYYRNFGKIQLISYVGTGTAGESGACSVTANFEIACALMIGSSYMLGAYMISDELSISYTQHKGFCTDYGSPYGYGKKSADGKTFYWYNKYADDQFNTSGEMYYVLVMGV